MTTLLFFNLFANATFSLWMGLFIVFVFNKIFRIPTGPWKLSLFMLPFIKVVFDFFMGVPTSSILYKNINPFTIKPGMQEFTLGVGAGYFGPSIRFLFAVKDENHNRLGASAGDYLYYWLSHKLGPMAPSFILIALICISSIFLIRRLSEASRFEMLRRKDRRSSLPFQTIKVGFRKVDIYLSERFTGTPFTGGVFRPYIAIPEETYNMLSKAEVDAVIAHELGHVRQYDVAFTMFIQVLGDIFWFVPGYRRLSRKIDRLREIVADQFAVQSGISGEYLASALLKLKEFPQNTSRFILYSAFTREKSLLKVRINNLLGDKAEKNERFGWRYLTVRIVVTFWIVGAVLTSNLAGNHTTIIRPPAGVLKAFADYFNLKTYSE